MSCIIVPVSVAVKPTPVILSDMVEQGIDAVIVRDEDWEDMKEWVNALHLTENQKIHTIETEKGSFLFLDDGD